MRNLKKFLALVLAMMMAMSLMVTANAADKNATDVVYSDGAQVTTFKEAVDVLSGMKVFQGDENGFRPADYITRGEVSAIIYRLITGDVEGNRVPVYNGFGGFTDVTAEEWFAPYVGYLANDQIIKGETNTTFNPYGNVTGYEALAMMLRAVGYDVNGEFTGPSWQTQVAATATELHVLDKINATRYANLNNPATREVVAELLFEVAYLVDTVTYTPAFGYQTAYVTAGGVNRDTLGWRNFGLTSKTGLIHGNKATGENSTKVMFADTIDYRRTEDSGTTSYAASVSYSIYTHPGAVLVAADKVIAGTGNATNAVRYDYVAAPAATSFDVDTGLDQFGHKVKIWYNDKDNGVKTTYAMYDQVTQVKAVFAAATTDINLDPDTSALREAASGFTNTDSAYYSDRFGTIGWNTQDKATDASNKDGKALSATNDIDHVFFEGTDTTQADDRNPGNMTNSSNLFMLISNSADKSLDVIISLAVELADITEWDTTATTRTLTIGELGVANNKGDVVNSKFGHDFDGDKTLTGKGTSGNGELRYNSVIEGSATALGTKVTAWEVKGTNSGNKNLMNYQLNEIQKPITGTVANYHRDTGRVTLTDGTVLDFTVLPVINDAVTIMRGTDYMFNSMPYTFYRDEFGRYTHFTQDNGYQFLYGAYADYSVGNLGSAKMDYVINGVDWDGNVKTLLPLKQINSTAVSGSNYEALTIAKKNQGGANGNNPGTSWIGNEIQAGKYTGYGYSTTVNNLLTEDNLTSGLDYTDHNDYPYDAEYYYKHQLKYDADTNWTLTATNAANGFKDVSEAQDGTLLITPATKFILVSGLGVDGDLKTEILTGLTGLLKGADYVKIDVDPDDDSDNDYNIYYRMNVDVYNNVQTQDQNNMVHTVILPAEAVKRSTTNNLFFTNRVTDNGIVLVDEHQASTTIKNYTLWQGGVQGNYWIDIDPAKGGVDPTTHEGEAIGCFYNLIPDRTVSGQTVYIAKALSNSTEPIMDQIDTNGKNGAVCNKNLSYEYFATNNTATAKINGVVMNVANVGLVVDLDNVNDGEPAHTEIKSVRDINNAISVGYTVTVAIVNDGLNVSTIYVTNVTK